MRRAGPVLLAAWITLTLAAPLLVTRGDAAPPAENAAARRPARGDATSPAANVEASDALTIQREPGIRDPVWAVLLGLSFSDQQGTLTVDRLIEEVERSGRPSALPYRMMDSTHRVRGPRAREAVVTTRFQTVIDLPVPYEILGYHPGSFLGTDHLVFREINLGTVSIAHQVTMEGRIRTVPFDLEDVHLFILEEGSLEIDIDGWLDALAGNNLDDTSVAGIAVFRRGDEVLGMAIGYNRKGEGRSGTLSFNEDRIVYPNPPDLKSAARQLRRTLEYYEPRFQSAGRDDR